ncbi:tryptophan--tRNA ligase [Candidatus Parcubacteria bacterium]|nr:tryptophan--tRNA ligase [Patescibacteria group bacterium]MBU4309896.1 tryptophan--tRNA ligase [Patescibacteria group bacterium]MBU4431904.1 tryptophan--tRNA ligase [Patescibacteria group bacterium]MBU4578235.1 tryptophan--tRNA ligase [Patescibacteria group bacterium]MCG2696771.1 tryptophan--tRNA ligase [Candidatus Parcubacteria bacterium]
MSKKRIFSGIKPSGDLHIGNYIGAISQWVPMQDEYEAVFCVVDYHAITVMQKPELLRRRIIEIAKIYLAFGIDPKKATIFQQSTMTEHTELAWILNCTAARMSDMNKMTQFKDKAGENQENVSVGLFDYPVLMAADIILYNTEIVPVGDDQLQHVELARDLARRFNHHFEQTFVVPQALIRKEGARIMALDNPEKKMSKSAESEAGYIALLDSPEKAAKKIMKATTDSGAEVVYNVEQKPGIANLLTIYSSLTGETIASLEKKYAGMNYGPFKKDLAEVVKNFLISFQEKYNQISDEEVRRVLDEGAAKVRPMAQEVLARAKKVLGM